MDYCTTRMKRNLYRFILIKNHGTKIFYAINLLYNIIYMHENQNFFKNVVYGLSIYNTRK